jgi:small subunit ribosomal protein S7e
MMQVPYRLLNKFHKPQQRLVRELEKKFSGKDVVFIANRRIMAPPKTGYALARPRSRTLTSVQSSVLLKGVHNCRATLK